MDPDLLRTKQKTGRKGTKREREGEEEGEGEGEGEEEERLPSNFSWK